MRNRLERRLGSVARMMPVAALTDRHPLLAHHPIGASTGFLVDERGDWPALAERAAALSPFTAELAALSETELPGLSAYLRPRRVAALPLPQRARAVQGPADGRGQARRHARAAARAGRRDRRAPRRHRRSRASTGASARGWCWRTWTRARPAGARPTSWRPTSPRCPAAGLCLDVAHARDVDPSLRGRPRAAGSLRLPAAPSARQLAGRRRPPRLAARRRRGRPSGRSCAAAATCRGSWKRRWRLERLAVCAGAPCRPQRGRAAAPARRAGADRRRGAAAPRALRDGVALDDDVAVVLFGSWGRRELTEHSDDDWLLLVDGPLRDGLAPDVEEVRSLLGAGDRRPGTQGAFGTVSSGRDLVQHIGLEEDDNRNLTQRMLLMLESVAVVGEDVHRRCWRAGARPLPGRGPQRPPAAALLPQRRHALLAHDRRRLRRQAPRGRAQVGPAQRQAAHVAQDALRRRAGPDPALPRAARRRRPAVPRRSSWRCRPATASPTRS